jgi:hypothetical protein
MTHTLLSFTSRPACPHSKKLSQYYEAVRIIRKFTLIGISVFILDPIVQGYCGLFLLIINSVLIAWTKPFRWQAKNYNMLELGSMAVCALTATLGKVDEVGNQFRGENRELECRDPSVASILILALNGSILLCLVVAAGVEMICKIMDYSVEEQVVVENWRRCSQRMLNLHAIRAGGVTELVRGSDEEDEHTDSDDSDPDDSAGIKLPHDVQEEPQLPAQRTKQAVPKTSIFSLFGWTSQPRESSASAASGEVELQKFGNELRNGWQDTLPHAPDVPLPSTAAGMSSINGSDVADMDFADVEEMEQLQRGSSSRTSCRHALVELDLR